MEKKIFEKQPSWQKDVSRIREKVNFREKEKKFTNNQEKKELIKETIAQEFKNQQVSFSQGTTLDTSSVSKDKKELLNYAIGIAKEKGITKAFNFVLKIKDPWLIDAFHDKLVEEVENEIDL